MVDFYFRRYLILKTDKKGAKIGFRPKIQLFFQGYARKKRLWQHKKYIRNLRHALERERKVPKHIQSSFMVNFQFRRYFILKNTKKRRENRFSPKIHYSLRDMQEKRGCDNIRSK